MENMLTDLFEYEEDKIIEQKEKVLMIDGHNLAYRNVYSTIYQDPFDNGVFDLWKHQMFQSIFYLLKKFKPTKLILAFDEKGSWRYSIYPEYKSARKINRNKGKIVLEHELFIETFEQFIDDVQELFSNVYTIKAKTAEADDIIAILSKFVFQDQEVYNVSCDSDLHQLITNNVKQYNPQKNKIVESLNIKKQLELKILSGDSSDSIKGIRKGVGIKTAEKIMSMGLENYIESIPEEERETVKENYKRNTTLIDLNNIPESLKDDIINIYTNYEIKDLDGKKVVRYFAKNKLTKHLSEWNLVSEIIKNLR